MPILEPLDSDQEEKRPTDLAIAGENKVLMQKLLTFSPFAIISLLVAGLATGYVKFHPERFRLETLEERRNGFQQKVRGVQDRKLLNSPDAE